MSESIFPEKQSKCGDIIMENIGGLTKRELFAAMAMQGFVLHYSGYVECNFKTDAWDTAKSAVKYADALIEALGIAEDE